MVTTISQIPTVSSKDSSLDFVCGFSFPGWRNPLTSVTDISSPSMPWPFARCTTSPQRFSVWVPARSQFLWKLLRPWFRRHFGNRIKSEGVFSWRWSDVKRIDCSGYTVSVRNVNELVDVQLQFMSNKSVVAFAAVARDCGVNVNKVRWVTAIGYFFQRRR